MSVLGMKVLLELHSPSQRFFESRVVWLVDKDMCVNQLRLR